MQKSCGLDFQSHSGILAKQTCAVVLNALQLCNNLYLLDVCRGPVQQPSRPRQPNAALSADNRLQQAPCYTQSHIPVCYPAVVESNVTASCLTKAAELPLQSGICTAEHGSTNACKHQISCICMTHFPECMIFFHSHHPDVHSYMHMPCN